MKLRVFPSKFTNQPRLEATTTKINTNIDEKYRFKLSIDSFFDDFDKQIIIDGDRFVLTDTEYFDVPEEYMSKTLLKVQFRFTKTTAVTSNELIFRIGVDVGEQTKKTTITEIPNFPEEGTKIELNETYKINGNLFICKTPTFVPSEISSDWLYDNFHTNLASGNQSTLEDYEALINLPMIGNKIVSGDRTIDYYGGYVKPSTGIPSSDLEQSIVQSIETAQTTANTANATANQANQTANSANSTANQASQQANSVADMVTQINSQIIELNNSLEELGEVINPDSKGNLPITKLPEIPSNTVLGNTTNVTGQAEPVNIANLPVGIIPDEHITYEMLVKGVQDLLDKADTAIQTLPTATSSVSGITTLGVEGGAATYTALQELSNALDNLQSVVEDIESGGSTKPENGWTYTDLSEGVQQALDLALTAIQSLPDATTVTKGVVYLGAPGGAARYEDVAGGGADVSGKVDKLETPTGKLLKSSQSGGIEETSLDPTEVASTITKTTILTGNDTVEGSVAYMVKQERDRALLVEADLQSQIDNIDTGGGSGGTTDHAELTNLDYVSSGHTGFASSSDITDLQDQIDELPTEADITNLQDQIDGLPTSSGWRSPLEMLLGETINGTGTKANFTSMLSGGGNPAQSSDILTLGPNVFLHYKSTVGRGVQGCIYGSADWSVQGPVDGIEGSTPFCIYTDFRGVVNGTLGEEGLKTGNYNFWRSFLTGLGFNNYWTTDDGVYYTLSNLMQDGLQPYTPPTVSVPTTNLQRARVYELFNGNEPTILTESQYISSLSSAGSYEYGLYENTSVICGFYRYYTGGSVYRKYGVCCNKVTGAYIKYEIGNKITVYSPTKITYAIVREAEGFGWDNNADVIYLRNEFIYSNTDQSVTQAVTTATGIYSDYIPSLILNDSVFTKKTLAERV